MKRIATIIMSLALIGLTLAQPPRKEEEDPNAKGKTFAPIDIDSFPDPKNPLKPAPKAKEPAAPEGPGVTPGKGVVVVGVRHLPERMSPSRARTDTERWALDLIFEGLVRPTTLDGGTTFVPALAIGPSRSELGGRAFTLDPAATWTDANHSPVLAGDVLSSVERLRAAGDLTLGDAFSDAPRRLRLTFRSLHPDPAALCTFKITPAGRDDDQFAQQPIGSGPFMYAGRVTEGKREYAVFKANPQYSQRAGRANRPQLREVRFLAGTEPLADFRRGVVDIVLEENTTALAAAAPAPEPKEEAIARLESGLGPDARMVTRPSRRIYYLAINPIKTALSGDAGRNLRRAIALGINREKILDDSWRQAGQPFHHALTGPFPPGTWPCDPAGGSLDDETLAKSELKSAKLPGGKVLLVYPAGEPQAEKACTLIANQLTQLGVPTEAKPLSEADFRKVVFTEKTFDLAWRHFDFRDDWFDPASLFAVDNGGIGGAGTGPSRLESALARCASRCEFAALRDARRRLHAEFREVMPFVPLWSPDVHIVLKRAVESAPAPDLLDPMQPFIEIERWRVNR